MGWDLLRRAFGSFRGCLYGPRARAVLARVAVLILGVAGLMVAGLPALPAATQSAPPSGVSITITDGGFRPAAVTVEAGQTIHWTNLSSQARSVAHAGGASRLGWPRARHGYSLALGSPATTPSRLRLGASAARST